MLSSYCYEWRTVFKWRTVFNPLGDLRAPEGTDYSFTQVLCCEWDGHWTKKHSPNPHLNPGLRCILDFRSFHLKVEMLRNIASGAGTSPCITCHTDTSSAQCVNVHTKWPHNHLTFLQVKWFCKSFSSDQVRISTKVKKKQFSKSFWISKLWKRDYGICNSWHFINSAVPGTVPRICTYYTELVQIPCISL